MITTCTENKVETYPMFDTHDEDISAKSHPTSKLRKNRRRKVYSSEINLQMEKTLQFRERQSAVTFLYTHIKWNGFRWKNESFYF